MNFMEKDNNNSNSSMNDCHYGKDLDQNRYTEMTLMTSTTREIGMRIGKSPTPPSQLDLMDASPSVATPSEEVMVVERAHMFDKVVTPSDVGKLNRLVIPKQHAEKYFPLDSSTNDKGILLNFEDVATGKLWRFTYSYWNSSQSYVMTKGWSRFVKEKKLDPGDIVSFLRAKNKLDRHFIGCIHRPPHHHPQLLHSANMNFSLHPRYFPGNSSFQHHGSSPTTMGWSTSGSGPPLGLFLPAHAATPLRGAGEHYYHPAAATHNPNWRTTGYNNNYYGGGTNSNYSHNNPSDNPIIYYRSSAPPTGISPHHHHQQQQSSSSGMMRFPLSSGSGGEMGSQGIEYRQLDQVLLHSVPVVQGKAAPKRLRLFGVNMDCPISKDDDDDIEGEEHDITILPSTTVGHHHNINTGATLLMPPPNSLPHLVQLRLNNNDNNNGASSSPQLLSSHHPHLQFH